MFVGFVAFLAARPNLSGGREHARVAMDVDLSEGWVTPDGTPVTLSALNSIPNFDTDGATICSKLPRSIEAGAELNYVSKNLTIHQYYDDEEVYTIDPDQAKFGIPYATRFDFTPLTSTDAGKTITLRIKPLYSDTASQILDMRISGTSPYIQRYVKAHGAAFVISLAIAFIGLAVLFLHAALRQMSNNQLDLLSLGCVSILLGIWSAAQTLVFELVTGLSALSCALEYIALLFSPFPTICFAASLIRPPHMRRFKFVGLLGLVATLCVTLTFVTVCGKTMHDALVATHAYLVLSAALIAAMVVEAVRSSDYSIRAHLVRTNWTVLATFLLFAVCASIDLVVFMVTSRGASDPAFFSRIGLLVFIVALAVEAFKASITFVRRANQTQMIEHMAYTDTLTGIGNRTSWQRTLEEVESTLADNLIEDVMVCQLDLNFLKRVNDTYGHTAGDDYLKSAADIINRSFGTEGTCFRTGGDEFTVILVGDSLESRLALCTELFNTSIQEQRQDDHVRVSIAMGWATVSETEERSVAAAQTLADTRMYAHKREMKAERVD